MNDTKKRHSITVDQTDKKIIAALKIDGRHSNSFIASQLKLSEGTVRSRIKNLIANDILKITGQTNPESLDDHQLALIGININESHLLEEKANAISKLPEVLNVSIAAGRYDLFAEVLIQTNHGLIDFLSEALPTIDGISNTETFLLLRSINKWIC